MIIKSKLIEAVKAQMSLYLVCALFFIQLYLRCNGCQKICDTPRQLHRLHNHRTSFLPSILINRSQVDKTSFT